MAKYMVQQSGPLKGEVVISGAKNAVLPLMRRGAFSRRYLCHSRCSKTAGCQAL